MYAMLMLMLLAVDAPTSPAPAAPPQSTVILDVTSTPDGGRVVEKNGVIWREWATHAGYIFKCGAPQAGCVHDKLVVRNESRATLRCHGKISYPQPNANGIPDAERNMIIPAAQSLPVVRSQSPFDMKMYTHTLDCRPEPVLPPLNKPPECSFKAPRDFDVDKYYPQAAKNELREGPVFLEFTLAAASAFPSSVKVIQTSLHPDLDAAAIRMFDEVEMTTNCPGQRFRTGITFRID